MPMLQEKKLAQAGVSECFPRPHVAPEKNAAILRDLISEGGFSPNETWLIGDSIKSDINLGIEAGAR